MKYTLLLFILSLLQLSAQTTKSIIAEVQLDSLVSTVEILTGEKPSDSFGTIPNRFTSNGRTSAFMYLEQRLKDYGIGTKIDNYRPGGYNVIGTQIGTKYPDSLFIVSAHYDSVDDFCADDNASGTSAVLEAARILSKYKFDFTIVYALWDEEEDGLIGSSNYARTASQNSDKIAGVLNMDMIGFDGDGDYLFEIHIGNTPKNDRLANKVTEILEKSNFKLEQSVQIPGTNRSDHASFWAYNFPAILVTEGFFNDDFNPAYHSSDDKLSLMRLEYYHQISQLVIGTMSELAVLSNPTSVESSFDITFDVYPNPTTDIIYLKKNTNIEITDIAIYNMTGRELLSLPPTDNIIKVDVSNLSTGIYTLVVNTADNRYTKTFVKF
ncbi:MAG: M28 family peptidase [Candidatus Kapaibacterium sp.]